jgi:hypothetical protein
MRATKIIAITLIALLGTACSQLKTAKTINEEQEIQTYKEEFVLYREPYGLR